MILRYSLPCIHPQVRTSAPSNGELQQVLKTNWDIIQNQEKEKNRVRESHYEVIEYKGRIGAAGILTNGKTVKQGTLAQCEKYCRTKGITPERV